MMWVAAVYSEVLVRVPGLDMEVSTNLAVFQVDPRIEEGDFFFRPRSCKFNSRMYGDG